MENISWMEGDIVECTPTIPFLNTYSVGIIDFVDPLKVVVQRSAFPILGNIQNESVSEVKTKHFGHGRLKHSFSQVEGNWIYKKSLNRPPFPKKE
jgi:hypothetical protein